MSSFRKIKTILREAAGSYVNGKWVAGTRSTLTSIASVQPITLSKLAADMIVLPEGRHFSDFVKVYSDNKLQVAADGEGIQPDIIVHEDFGYELIGIEPNRSDVINHYKYTAAKLFKFTSNSDWTDGTLKRTYDK